MTTNGLVSEQLFAEAKRAREEGRCKEAIAVLENAAKFARRVFEHQPEHDLHAAWAAVQQFADAFPLDGWTEMGASEVLANVVALEEAYNAAHVCNVCVVLEVEDDLVVKLRWGACERDDDLVDA